MNFTDQQYQYLMEKFGVTESYFIFYRLDDEARSKALEVSDETIAMIQNLLSRAAHEKLNFSAQGEYPLEDARQLARIDGKIAVLRELLDSFTLRRLELIRSR